MQDAVENAQDGDIITLTQDITVPDSITYASFSSSCLCWLHCTKNITIQGSSSTTTISFSSQILGFLGITDGCTINLENVTIDFGKNDNITRSTTLIQISDHSILNLNSGTTLQNAMVNNINPIYATNYSKININQGASVISLASSVNGVIYLNNNRTLNLNGLIQNCSIINGGAVFLASNSTFTQNRRTITDCHANKIDSSGGDAIYVDGASKLTFKGTISNCTAKNGVAILIYNGSTLQAKGTIENCEANKLIDPEQSQSGNDGGAIYL